MPRSLRLGALGITLVFGVLRFANLAHGDLMAFGAMATILATWLLQAWGVGIDPLPTALLALPFGMAAAATLAADRMVFRFYRRKRGAPIVFVMASLGVMFVLNGAVRFIIGPDDRQFTDGARFLVKAREFKQATGLAKGLSIKTTQCLTVAVAVIVVILVFRFLQRTRTGKSMRAYSDNENLALLSGIDPERVALIAWAVAAALAAIAGALYGLDKSFKPFTYFQLLLPMFAAAILGGIGQPVGAFSEVTATYAWKKFLHYLLPEPWRPDGLAQLLSTGYKFAVSFAILVLVLLLRPSGIFRGRVL